VAAPLAAASKDQDIGNLVLLQVGPVLCSVIGVLFLTVVVIGAVETLTLGEILSVAIVCLLFGMDPCLPGL